MNQNKKKVLIITYYWPPSGGSGVQRWLKFTKYLRDYGWEPIIFTPENPEYMNIDNTLLAEIPQNVEVIKRKIIEPYSLYKLLTGKKNKIIKPGFINANKSGTTNIPFSERISLFIRSNIFIPDPKSMWIHPSASFLKKYIRENPVDVIVSTGPPHSMHLIAKKIAKSTGIPWLADFRDPWTNMYNFKYMKYSTIAIIMHKMLERRVVRSADTIVTVSKTIASELRQIGAKSVCVITNGYDHTDFTNTKIELDSSFSITYTGLFVKIQNPLVLWNILGEMAKNDSYFASVLKIRLISHSDIAIIEDIRKNDLIHNLEVHDYLPHERVITFQRSSQILLLSGGMEPQSKGILPGKFFEYLAARRPILCFGPKGGDLDIAIKECEAGKTFEFDDISGCRKWLEERYAEYLIGKVVSVSVSIEKYSRKVLTRKLSELLNILVKKC